MDNKYSNCTNIVDLMASYGYDMLLHGKAQVDKSLDHKDTTPYLVKSRGFVTLPQVMRNEVLAHGKAMFEVGKTSKENEQNSSSQPEA